MFEWIQYILDSIKNFFTSLVLDIVEILYDVVMWIWDQLLSIIDGLLNSFDMPVIDTQSWWGGIPSDILQLAGYCNFDDGLLMIVAALLIRLILNFVPFVGG